MDELILCDGRVRAFQGDCLDILSRNIITDIDVVLTDPPYAIARNFIIQRPGGADIDYNFGDWDKLSEDEYLLLMETFYSQANKTLNDSGSIVTFTSTKWISFLSRIEEKTGFVHKADMVWHKTNPTPHFRKTNYLSSIEMVSWAVVNNKDFYLNFVSQNEMHNYLTGSICHRNNSLEFIYDNWRHKTQKPIWLMEELARRHCKENAIVLDPFAGSGSTAIGVLRAVPNAEVILIEKNEEIFDNMCKRISNWWSSGLDRFLEEKPLIAVNGG